MSPMQPFDNRNIYCTTSNTSRNYIGENRWSSPGWWIFFRWRGVRNNWSFHHVRIMPGWHWKCLFRNLSCVRCLSCGNYKTFITFPPSKTIIPQFSLITYPGKYPFQMLASSIQDKTCLITMPASFRNNKTLYHHPEAAFCKSSIPGTLFD